MDYVNSFSAMKAKRAYMVFVYDFHPDGTAMLFQVDTGASVTLAGLNSFCHPDKKEDYILLKKIIEEAIEEGEFHHVKRSASTATKEEVEMYPCKYVGVSVSGTKPITLYFHIFLGDVNMPLLGFDYIDDCSLNHSVGGNLVVNAIAEHVGRRFYPEKVIDFNAILERFQKERQTASGGCSF